MVSETSRGRPRIPFEARAKPGWLWCYSLPHPIVSQASSKFVKKKVQKAGYSLDYFANIRFLSDLFCPPKSLLKCDLFLWWPFIYFYLHRLMQSWNLTWVSYIWNTSVAVGNLHSFHNVGKSPKMSHLNISKIEQFWYF